MRIIGRIEEQEKLKYAINSKRPEFVVVYGRRRIGKTFLIKEYFNDKFSFYCSGILSKSMKLELTAFNNALIKSGYGDKTKPESWFDAFDRLERAIEEDIIKVDERYNKRIIFLDELPWFDTARSDFKAAFDNFWNTFASRQDNLVLIACGSATSWILKNLINSKGGFHNRITSKIHLKPFDLNESRLLINELNGNELGDKEIIDAYMIFGGVPFYLNYINPNFSLMQNIDNIIFKEGSELNKEYDNLFSSSFKKYENHSKVIETLAKKRIGLTRNEISNISKIASGQTLSIVLEELEECGFIRKYTDYKKKNNNSLYQIIDPFTLFSLNFLKDKKFALWINYVDSPSYYSWCGYSFEIVCLNHIDKIKKVLGIDGIDSLNYSFYSNSNGGAQIDLLIDRKDNVINLCEMKYSIDKYNIDEKYEQNIINKIKVFKEISNTKKAIIVTFITLNGINKNKYSGIVRKELIANELF